MTSSQIDSTYKSVINLLLAGKLKLAFDKTRLLVAELQWGELTDEFEDLLRNYRYMLQYFIEGVDDPDRKSVYNKLISRLISLNALVREELMVRIDNTFEYTQKRYFPHKLHFSSVSDLYDSFVYFHNQQSILNESEVDTENEKQRIRSNYEKLLLDLFAIFWLSTHIRSEEKKVFKLMINEAYPASIEQNLIISALTLNIWRMFDEEKIMLLLDACQHKDMQVRQRALVGLCFVLTKYNDFLHFYPSIRNRLVILVDHTTITENLKNIILLIIGTTDTDRITKKMQEEILPEMIKISPVIRDKIEEEKMFKSDDWNEENPEWSEILEQSGIADKLQELTELQMEGADVYMSTFSMLKNFPFFNETAHWFLHFDPEFSAIQDLFRQHDQSLVTAFLKNNIICNSDKYSFCLSALQMPAGQRSMMSKSFKAEAKQLEEISKEETLLNPDLAARNIARQYIQDLFRFFRLHPRHQDFNNMFKLSLNIHKTTFFDVLASGSDIKLQAAEYYFTKKLYVQAIEVYEELIQEQEPSAALYQKIGFSYQKNAQINQALNAYIKADLILPDDLWTVKKIAICHRLSGDYEKALEAYRHADFLKPGEFNTNMQIANCLIQLEKYKAALQVYADIEKNNPDNENLWRAVSRCAFLSTNIHQADYYMDKILSAQQPRAIDLINAGHIAFCKHNRSGAVQFYLQSIEQQADNLQLIIDQIIEDRKHLIANGINNDDIALLIDELSFSVEQTNQ